MTDNITPDNLFYVGDVPWHGVGNRLENVATAQEAIEAASLNWGVEQRPIYYADRNGEHILHPSHVATIRKDKDLPLGIVSKSYQIVQNVDCFSFLDALVDSGEAKYEVSGELAGGRKIWLLAKLPSDIVLADGDTIQKYLLFVNTHDGTSSVKVALTPVRVVCQNTLSIALQKSEFKVSIIHSGDIDRKINEARRILKLSVRSYDEMKNVYNLLAATKISDEKAKQYFEELYDPEKHSSKHYDEVRSFLFSLYKEGPTADTARGTVWGVYNAATDYFDHYRGRKKQILDGKIKNTERIFKSAVLGGGRQNKIRAFALAHSIAQSAA